MSGLGMLKQQPLTMAHFLLQRRITQPRLREAVSACVALTRPRAVTRPADASSARESVDLAQRGFCTLPGLVSEGRVRTLRAYFEGFKAYYPYDDALEPFLAASPPANVNLGYFDHATVVRGPGVLEIANDPRILAIVGDVLGAKPLITYLTAWWSFPHEGPAIQAENFHRDVDDWRFIKLFIYLTDVGPGFGPHKYVPGSHRSDRLLKIRRYTDEDVVTAFGEDQIHEFTGPAGTAFLENTYGLHKGTPPTIGRRLILQAVYALRRMPYGPPRPVWSRAEAGGAELDPYVNGIYLS